MSKYYKLENRNLTLRDCWCLTRNANALFLMGAKLFRVPLDIGSYLPEAKPFRNLLISESDLIPECRAKIARFVEDFQRLGFHSPIYHTLKDNLVPTLTFGVAMLSSDHLTMGKIIYVKQMHGQIKVENAICAFVSVLSDDRYLVTGRKAKGFAPSAKSISNKLSRRASTEQLLRSHQEKLRTLRGVVVQPIANQEDLIRVCGEYETFFHNSYIERGIYREVPPDEVALVQKAQGLSTPIPPPVRMQEQPVLANADGGAPSYPGDASASGSPPPLPDYIVHSPVSAISEQTARVQIELAKLLNPKQSWKSNAWLLVITGVLFVMSFKGQSSWEGIWMLLVILLFHESGHYLAMRLFHYRNVRMFFLPFFGAAVTGRHYSVPGWRKAIVSLMGPVPGIVVGAGILWALSGTDARTWSKLGVLFILINAFNLIPFLPLDGGWFWHTIVFSRNRWIEAIFQIGTSVLLILFSFFVLNGSILLPIVGVFMIIASRVTFKAATIADELRAEGYRPEMFAAEEIPAGLSARIVEKLNEKLPRAKMNAKLMAQQVLNIYERLAGRSPGFLQSFLLILIYVGAVSLAVVWVVLPYLFRFYF